MERVSANGARRYLSSDHDQWGRVHVGVANGRDDVRGARTAGHHGHTGSTRGERVSLGHVTGTLFVAHEDVTNRRVDQRVVHGQDRPTRQPENGVHPLLLEALDECLGSCKFHDVPLFLYMKKGLPYLGGLRYTSERDYRRQAPTTTRRTGFWVVTPLSKHM